MSEPAGQASRRGAAALAEGALNRALAERILVLDGAMGSLIQRLGFSEADFRGERLADHPRDLAGNNDLLSLTQPEAIAQIYRDYLAAGADIVTTNTFGATAISQADYGTEALSYDMNRAAAALAREAADEWSARTPERPRFVAGSLGPTNKTLSLSPRVEDPGYRDVDFEEVRTAYYDAARGLVDGGAHLLLVETIFDTLMGKAALFALEQLALETGVRTPLMISLTVTDKSGRTLSGQTVDAFWASVEHARPFSLGVNCSFGARELRPSLAQIAALSPVWTSAHPNAGLPNAFGGYDETPEETAALLREFAECGLVNIVGGCCGTTPEHVAAIAEAVAGVTPRALPAPAGPVDRHTRLAGLETYTLRPDGNFTMVGERTNVAGSRRFARLIAAGDFEAAVEVARQQVRGGANLIDVNMDEALLDSVAAMERFLKLVATEPEIARLPVMVDSSRWEVIEAGLRCLQGKGVVNSLSLAEGEDEFLCRARLVRRHGAAVLVMAFDEEGQAETAERKVAVLRRAFGLLTEKAGFPAEDVILDPGVLAVATGLEEHRGYAVAFLDALRRLKRECPGARTSGGISNLSFAFRGRDAVREAMHAAFLYHAIEAGLDMGIVNAGQLAVYDDLPPELRERVEDVLFDRRPDAAERLIELAATVEGGAARREEDLAWREAALEERLAHALVHGVLDHMEDDLAEAGANYDTALSIIEGPLMAGMDRVGDLFAAGKMFLPQVVKSARAMKKAVAILGPRLETESSGAPRRGKVLLATVKGDVHDIGKNIVGVVLGCNGFEIVDLGVMVPGETILERAQAESAEIVGLSGLITPSLDEMRAVAREMQRCGLTQPLLIGGATTSREHTAVRIAPEYGGSVLHVKDASRAVGVVAALRDESRRAALDEKNRREQSVLRERHAERVAKPLMPLRKARANRQQLDWEGAEIPVPSFTGRRVVEASVDVLREWIDWTFFFSAWELKGRHPRILDHPEHGQAARELLADAETMLDELTLSGALRAAGIFGFWPAAADGEDIVLFTDDVRTAARARFPMLRQEKNKAPGKPNFCLADFVAPLESGREDYLGAFAVTAGLGAGELVREHERAGDDYRAIMVKALADRLAEAFAEYLHAEARREWGYGAEESLSREDLVRERYRGIRPAFGYPACPDHSEKFQLFSLLGADEIGLSLTEQAAMRPAASVSGLYFSHAESRYFDIGRISREQVGDYAKRKGVSVAEVERWLATRLNYDPA